MQPFAKLLLTILLAHLLGDFPLQTSSMVEGKGKGSRAYLAHGGIHFLVLTLCMAAFAGLEGLGSLSIWIAAGAYIVLHLGIDRAKQRLLSTKKIGGFYLALYGRSTAARVDHGRAVLVSHSTELDRSEIGVRLVTGNRRASARGCGGICGSGVRGRILDWLSDQRSRSWTRKAGRVAGTRQE